MSFLERHQQDGEYVLKHVPDITGLQLLIEQAWKEGKGQYACFVYSTKYKDRL
jgi:hypothetical protein